MVARELSPWKQAPFIRLLIPFITGIIIQRYLQQGLQIIIIISSIPAAFFIFYRFLKPADRYRYRRIAGLALTLALLGAGMSLLFHHDIRNDPVWFNKYYTKDSVLQVRISDVPEEKQKSFKAIGIIEKVICNKSLRLSAGKLIIYFDKESSPSPGDVLLLTKRADRIKNSGNPGSFDYAAYAADRGIYHQVFLKKEDFVIIRRGDQHWFQKFLQNSRLYFVESLRRFLKNDPLITGIAEALVIGYKNDLDKQLLKAYSAAGVVHIIAISGLHLGMIFYILDFIFKKLPWLKSNKSLKAFLIILSLWLFALLTGGSASVLRSALMFSFMIAGKAWFRNVSVYNSLASSSFILLCYNPFYLWDVGFQLSYLAVFGIVWLQRPINNAIYFHNPALRKIWELASVTLSAQVAAFPICLYYFHQFPVLFLFTNIIIVPLSSIILFGGLLIVILSSVPLIAGLLGKLVSSLITIMNYIVNWFVGIRWSVINSIPADFKIVLLIYILVFFIAGYCLWRKKKWLYLSFITAGCLFLLNAVQYLEASRQSKIIVYNIKGNSAVEFISGTSSCLISDSGLVENSPAYDNNILPSRIFYRVGQSGVRNSAAFKILSFKSKRILLADSSVRVEPLSARIYLDILVISGNPSLDIKNLVEAFNPGIIIFDSSNSLWKIAKWKRECEELLLRFHSVPEEGAIILDTG